MHNHNRLPPNPGPSAKSGLQQSLTRFAAFLTTAALAIGAFFISAFIFILILAVGLVLFAVFWWKSRKLRRAMRTAREQAHSGGQPGEVIEGELVREVPPEKPS